MIERLCNLTRPNTTRELIINSSGGAGVREIYIIIKWEGKIILPHKEGFIYYGKAVFLYYCLHLFYFTNNISMIILSLLLLFLLFIFIISRFHNESRKYIKWYGETEAVHVYRISWSSGECTQYDWYTWGHRKNIWGKFYELYILF